MSDPRDLLPASKVYEYNAFLMIISDYLGNLGAKGYSGILVQLPYAGTPNNRSKLVNRNDLQSIEVDFQSMEIKV